MVTNSQTPGIDGLGRTRPIAYIVTLILTAIATYVYSLRTEGIFACPGDRYGTDQYLAYCHADQYGDYDHGAFWFDLEPGLHSAASDADLVFLGNSRMQFAFSGKATADSLAALGTRRFFLLGFEYSENYTFEKALIPRLDLRARAYVLNVDTYFEDRETPPAKAVMHDDAAENHYRRKRLWQVLHKHLCGWVSQLCADKESYWRERANGSYHVAGGRRGSFPVAYDEGIDPVAVRNEVQRGGEFLATLPVAPSCVFLTLVPSGNTKTGTAKAIAAALGMTLVAPQTRDLATWDHSHLDPLSADRWAQDFFHDAEPRMRECLQSTPVARG